MKGTHSLFQLALENQAAGIITSPPNLLSAEHRRVWNANSSRQETRTYQDWNTHQRQRLERQLPFASLLKALLAEKDSLPMWPVNYLLVVASPVAVAQVLPEPQVGP